MLVSACSPLRFLDENEQLLTSVKLTSEAKQVKPGTYRNYVRQEPNSKWFNLAKVPLSIYCLQGSDSTRHWSRFIRRVGEAPVVYDAEQAAQSRTAIERALQDDGYLHARVRLDTTRRGRRLSVNYHLLPGRRSYVRDIRYQFDDTAVGRLVRADSASSLLRRGMPLQASQLSAERSRIVRSLQERGYYRLHNEFISFLADTIEGDYGVVLTLSMSRPTDADSLQAYEPHRLRVVSLYEDSLPAAGAAVVPTFPLERLAIHRAGQHRRLRGSTYRHSVYLRPDSLYRRTDVEATYRALGALPATDFSSVSLRPDSTGQPLLDADIFVRTAKPHTISAELEGTNTAGNLGAAVVLTYSCRNLFHGSEMLTLKARGAYEAITGLEGYNNHNYLELSAEMALRVPSTLFPRLTGQGAAQGASEFSVMFNSQNRPEFHRRVLTAAWAYNWRPQSAPRWQHRMDLLSLNYVYMPWISDTFRSEYLEGDDPHFAVLRHTYENLFILHTGYGFTYRSDGNGLGASADAPSNYQVRFGFELAGNLLYAAQSLAHASRDANGQYNILGIAYSQYAKFDLDFARSLRLNERNGLAMHAMLGIAVPYGNSTIVPYEKRYFAGGANSVRGWGVRELGPGTFQAADDAARFVRQTGNLKLDLSLELRTHLFWKIRGALFIDAGNVWTLRSYADQPGGQFRWNKFLREIAVAYGLGLRLHLDYFVLRLDCGFKAVNPAATGREHYPIICPRLSRDAAFHFAVGLPF